MTSIALAAYTCDQCHDAGWFTYDCDIHDHNFGKLHRCPCQQSSDVAQKCATLRANSGLNAVSTQTFVTFDPDHAGTRSAYRAARAFANQPEGFLYLYGSYGSGKTHLAMAIGNALIDAAMSIYFAVVPDLLDKLQVAQFDGYGAGYERLTRQLRTVDVLILDDLGAEKTTEWRTMQLYLLVNERYQLNRPTIITSNLAPSSDRWEPRLRSRLCDDVLVHSVNLQAADYRALPVEQRWAA